MNIDQAAVFLAGSILTGLGFIVAGIVVLVLNNLFSKHWKPVKWGWTIPEYRFAELDKTNEPKMK